MSQDPDAKGNRGVVMDVRVGQTLMVGGVRITVEKKDGQRARLRVVAEKDIVICRLPQEIAPSAA